jgi:hypothetical protein
VVNELRRASNKEPLRALRNADCFTLKQIDRMKKIAAPLARGKTIKFHFPQPVSPRTSFAIGPAPIKISETGRMR